MLKETSKMHPKNINTTFPVKKDQRNLPDSFVMSVQLTKLFVSTFLL